MSVAVNATNFVEINHREQLKEIFFKGLKNFYVLGGGSNVLFLNDYLGTILKINIKGIKETHLSDEVVELTVCGGENWHQLVLYALAKNYGGLENLSLIPGTVGASPIQNIGAYGVEVKDLITKVKGYNVLKNKFEVFSKEDCKFGYRDSIFKKELKDSFIITEVVFNLSKKNHTLNLGYGAIQNILEEKGIQYPTIQDVSNAVIEIREQKLPNPSKEPNTGSFFKNPIITAENFLRLKKLSSEIPYYEVKDGIKIPAGWLIEKSGWKGKKVDGVGVHPQQALVIVNYECKSGLEVFNFSERIIKDVQHKFGITLEREVNIVK